MTAASVQERQMKRILVTRPYFDDIIDTLDKHVDVERIDLKGAAPEMLAQRLVDKDGVLSASGDRIDDGLLRRCPRLRVVCNIGAGFDNVDVAACSAHGVVVANTPDAVTESTADVGMGLILAASRRIAASDRFVRAGQWRAPFGFDENLGADVHGTVLGIIGMGRIGRAVARRGRMGFGMSVLYHNRNRLTPNVELDAGAEYASFDTLLATADHVIVTLPYSAGTHHLIDAQALGKMKRSATLTNIGRGGVVDEAALVDALRAGWLGAAALDVFEREPLNDVVTRLDHPALVMTAHIGSATLRTRRAMVTACVDNLVSALAHDQCPTNALNPDAWSKWSTA
jgi:glyoxylate/hydroxypyruvate/2-ketogluconate reductase